MELWLAALAFVAAVDGGQPAPAGPGRPMAEEVGACSSVGSGRLRPGHADLSDLISRGCTLSPTFNDLVDRLERSDVIVFTRFARCSNGVASCLHFLGAADGSRSLRISVDRFGRAEWQILALIAHELQHALEIADEPDAKDVASVGRVFERLGWRGSAGLETAHAAAIARVVEREVTARRRR